MKLDINRTNRTELNYEGYTFYNFDTDTMVRYSFPHGYNKLILRIYELSSMDFVRESVYYEGSYLYKRHLENYRKLEEAEVAKEARLKELKRTKLLTKESAKLDKSQNDEWLNRILYLEPTYNQKVCPAASEGCKKTCLVNSGMMKMPTQKNARAKRTELYFDHRELFMEKLYKEIRTEVKKAAKEGKKLALRLNGTSDLNWTKVYKDFPEVQFYEYTKRTDTMARAKNIANLNITFSRTENTDISDIRDLINQGQNVAVVFEEIPTEWEGLNILDGDKTDRRFEDEKGSIVGLKFKGAKALKVEAINNGFCVA